MINRSDLDGVSVVVFIVVVASVQKCKFMIFDFDMVQYTM